MDLISINSRPNAARWSEEYLAGAMGILETDPLMHRIPSEDVPDLLNLALEAGDMQARKVLEQYGVPDPLKIAQKLDLRIIFDITTKGYRKAFNALSCYIPNPATIVIYENTLQLFRETMESDPGFPREMLVKLTNICVAHELYHHLEAESFNFINLIYKVKIMDLGLVKIERTPGTLAEIAANAFAGKLMGLSFFPTIINGALYEVDDAGKRA